MKRFKTKQSEKLENAQFDSADLGKMQLVVEKNPQAMEVVEHDNGGDAVAPLNTDSTGNAAKQAQGSVLSDSSSSSSTSQSVTNSAGAKNVLVSMIMMVAG